MLLFLLVVLAIDFAISIWNAYSSGYAIGLIKKSGSSFGSLTRLSAYSGLGLGFVGMTYVLVVVLSYAAYYAGYVTYPVVAFAISLDFLVFGILIIGFGLVVTVQSIVIAAKKKSLGSILIAIWNTFAEVWDIASYVSGFQESTQLLRRNRQGSGSALAIVAIALLIAFFIVHAAYKHGYSKAMGG